MLPNGIVQLEFAGTSMPLASIVYAVAVTLMLDRAMKVQLKACLLQYLDLENQTLEQWFGMAIVAVVCASLAVRSYIHPHACACCLRC